MNLPDYVPPVDPRDATIATITAALEEARGALEPFEKADDELPNEADWLADNKASGVSVSFYAEDKDDLNDWRTNLKVGDLRRATRAIATINAALGRVEG
jgi:hypothetical protein